MNEKSTTAQNSEAASKEQQHAAPGAGQDLNLLNRMQEAEEQQAGHAQVDTGITETDRNNFDEEHHQDTKRGAGHM